MKKRFSCIILVVIMVFSAIPLSVTAEGNDCFEDTSKEMMDSYVRVITYAEENEIPLGMSLDVYETCFAESAYESLKKYEQATIMALSSQDLPTIENSLDKSPLDYLQTYSGANVENVESESSKEPVDENESKDSAESDLGIIDASAISGDSELIDSYNRVHRYILNSNLECDFPYDQFVKLYYEHGLTIQQFENLMCQSIDETVAPKSSLSEGYYNNCGTSLPSAARYGNYNLLASLKKGDILYEAAGIVELVGGHAGIVVGRFFDTSSGRFYIRCVEAVASGVKYGIIDDGRVDTTSLTMYRVSTSSLIRDRAVAFCKSQLGADWSVIGLEKKPQPSGHWYCSELVWAGYKRQGIDLDAGTESGVRAQEILLSPYISQINISWSQQPSNRMTDISSHWGKTAILHIADDGIIAPVTSSRFEPDANATRSVCVVGLYQMTDGEEYYSFEPYTDVPDSASYRDAVAWANNCGITLGTSPTTFSPNSAVKRQDFAVFLYRFASFLGCSTTYNSNALNSFTDRGSISSYASTAMKWAVTKGIMDGRSPTTIVPKGTITRAELATMLYRFQVNLM